MCRRTMKDELEIKNGSEVVFENIGGAFTVVQTAKGRYGNEHGQILVNKDGEEFKLINENGKVSLAKADAFAAIPKPVGEVTVLGDSDWFQYKVGGYDITA